MPIRNTGAVLPASPTFVTETVSGNDTVGGTLAVTGTTTTTGGIIYPVAAPAAGRRLLAQLAKIVGYNLNSVALVTLFTTPASGFTGCVINEIVLDNFSGASGTVQLSFGASGTPTDFLGTQTLTNGATGKAISLYPAANAAYAVYGTAVAFSANQTVAQGVATTCDITILGYYE